MSHEEDPMVAHFDGEDSLVLDGLCVSLWRSEVDGKLVICVTNDSDEMQPRDLAEGDVPIFRLAINDQDDAYHIDETDEGVIP